MHAAATITLLSTGEDGRKTPVADGYRPQFFYNDRHWDATLKFYGWKNPGETFSAEINFLAPQAHKDNIHIGMKFQLCEGQRVVANGTITYVNL